MSVMSARYSIVSFMVVLLAAMLSETHAQRFGRSEMQQALKMGINFVLYAMTY